MVALWLILRRHTCSVAGAERAYVLIAAIVSWVLLSSAPGLAALGPRWVPYQELKLACFVAALVAPTFRSGIAGIAMHGGGAIVQYLTLDAVVRGRMAAGEPLATVTFLVGGFVTLVVRYRSLMHERAAEAMASLLYVRDLMNTPLQTIELGTALLRDESAPSALPTLTMIQNAVASMRQLNDIKSGALWPRGTPESSPAAAPASPSRNGQT